MMNIENHFPIEIRIDIFSVVSGLSRIGIVFVLKWFHRETHWNLNDLMPWCIVLTDGIDKQPLWWLLSIVKEDGWLLKVEWKRVRRSLGIRLLQYSYASFNCCNLITSLIFSIFNSMNSGFVWASKSANVRILTHLFW